MSESNGDNLKISILDLNRLLQEGESSGGTSEENEVEDFIRMLCEDEKDNNRVKDQLKGEGVGYCANTHTNPFADLIKKIEENQKAMQESAGVNELLKPKPLIKKTKSTFAAYSYDRTTPVPLPASVMSEEMAVQYMEQQGYQHFEVYRKLGTYKLETKTELVRQ